MPLSQRNGAAFSCMPVWRCTESVTRKVRPVIDHHSKRSDLICFLVCGALGLLATGQSFWALSLIAEVYTPQTVLLAGLVLALLRWRERPTLWRTSGVGLLVGLGFSHHASTVLLLPGVAACFLFQTGAPTLKPRT